MSCNKSKQDIMDYLYAEMSEEQHLEFKAHLEQCQSCRAELASLKTTSNILASWQDEEPALKYNFVGKPSGRRLWPANWPAVRRFVLSAAGTCAALMVLLSLVNFRVSYSGSDFSMHMSLFPGEYQSRSTVNEPESPSQLVPAGETPVTRAEFTQWQKDSYEVVKAMLEESETQQNRHFAAILASFADDIEAQRQQDLRFVGQGLETFRWSNQQDIRRSAQALQQLILASTQPGDMSEIDDKYQIPNNK